MTTFTAEPAATLSTSDPANVEVAALVNGNFVGVWTTAEGVVLAQVFDRSGQSLGNSIQIASEGTPTGVAGLADGGFVVELQVGSHPSTRTVSTQRVDAAGQLAGPQVLQSNSPLQPDGIIGGLGVFAAPDGGYYASYVQHVPAQKGYGAHYQLVVNKVEAGGDTAAYFASEASFAMRFANAVAPDGDVVLVRADSAPSFTVWPSDGTGSVVDGGIARAGLTPLDQLGGPIDATPSAVSATFLADGNLLLVWQAGPGASVGENQLQGQLFDLDVRQPTGPYTHDISPPASPLLTFTGAVGSSPKVTALASGGFVLSWDGQFAQVFDAGGQATTEVMQIGSQDIAPTPDGGFVVLIDDGASLVEQTYTPEPAPGDATAPVPIYFFPEAGDPLPPDWSPGITFSEPVKAGSGTITLQDEAGQVVQTFGPGDPGLQFFGASVLIDPSADLQPGTSYMLVFGADAIQDLAGNSYSGDCNFRFTTAGDPPPPPGGDTTAPSVIDFFPGATPLPVDWSLGITFNEEVQAGSGTITLQTAAGEVVQTFSATDPGIHYFGASVLIDPAADLQPGTTYQLTIGPGAFQDLAGNAQGTSAYSFTTAGEPPPSGDTTAPVYVDFFPAAGSNTLPVDWSPGITFSEPVQAGSGPIVLRERAGEVVQTFSASDPGIHYFGASVLIDPAADLKPGTTYELLVEADAFEDLAGNATGVVAFHTFTTAGAPPPQGDTTDPFAVDFYPFPGSGTLLPTDWSPGMTFTEEVKAGTGTITLQTFDGQLVQTFAATDPGVLYFGASVLIDPAADLLPGTTYTLTAHAGAFEDLAGNDSRLTSFSFSTEAALVGVPSSV